MAKEEAKDANSSIRHLVRIVNTDLLGSKRLIVAMGKIKGVSFMFANAVCAATGVDGQKITGTLGDTEVKKLEDAILNPAKYNIPTWLYNRRKDVETGVDAHLLNVDLKLSKEDDIKRMKKTKSYKGLRHQWGLTVRGQKTKSNFRRNKGKVSLGVKRKKGAKSGK